MNAPLVLHFICIEPILILFVHTAQNVSSYLFLSVDYNPPECEVAHALHKYEYFEGTCFLHVYNNNTISSRIAIHRINFVSNNICLSINITQSAFQTQWC